MIRLLTLVSASLAGFATFAFAEQLAHDKGASGVWQKLTKLTTTASLLHITAHPDDEHGGMLTLSSRGQCVRVSLLSLTRGEAGANAIGPELFDDLGSIRAEELTLAGRYYGLDALYFTRLADYGYSTIALWGPRCLSDLGEPTVARATAYWPVARIWRARDTRSSPPPGAPSGPLEVMTSVPLSTLSK